MGGNFHDGGILRMLAVLSDQMQMRSASNSQNPTRVVNVNPFVRTKPVPPGKMLCLSVVARDNEDHVDPFFKVARLVFASYS